MWGKSGLILWVLTMSISADGWADVPSTRLEPTVRAIGDPSAWITSEDYPAAALRFGMEGRVGIRIFVDTQGKVFKCDVTESSGFDVLDKGACSALEKNASFIPAKDKKGRPVEDSFTRGVVWRLPSLAPMPWKLGLDFDIDKLGHIVSCRKEDSNPMGRIYGAGTMCTAEEKAIRPDFGLAMRNYGETPVVRVRRDIQFAVSAAEKDRALAEMSAGKTMALTVWRGDIDKDGNPTQCVLESQKGSEMLIFNMCDGWWHRRYQPPQLPFGLSSAPVWLIVRHSLAQ